MRQRHNHPRIGPAYQAIIPPLEGAPYPHVPLRWLGEAVTAEAEAAATSAESGVAPAVPGRTSGRSRGGAAGHKQQNAASQASRPVTRKMRATAARTADNRDEPEQQHQQSWKPAPAEDMSFSASLLADAAKEIRELNASLLGERFVAAPSRSTAAGSDTVAIETAPVPATLDAPAEAEATFCGGFPPGSSSDTFTDAGTAAGISADITGTEATGAQVPGASLCSEIPRDLVTEVTTITTAENLPETAVAGDTAPQADRAESSAASSDATVPAALDAIPETARVAEKHQLTDVERSLQNKKQRNADSAA